MINVTTQKVIKELNSSTKIRIACHMLKQVEGMTVTELTTNLENITRINISKQINEMRRAGLLNVISMGRNNIYTLNPDLSPAIVILIKTIVNSYHIIDEKRADYVPYK